MDGGKGFGRWFWGAGCDEIFVLLPQLEEGGEERLEPRQGAPFHEQHQQESAETPRESQYLLQIRNATARDSGTYHCTLEELNGSKNHSGTVTLKVTGEWMLSWGLPADFVSNQDLPESYS